MLATGFAWQGPRKKVKRMASSQTTDRPPKQPPKPISYLAGFLVLVVFVSLMAGAWLLFTQVIVPMIPQRVIPHPEGYRGVGEPLAYLELEPLTGKQPRLTLPELRNHVVLLSFWGTWCPPCRAELPHIAELQKRFTGQEAFRLVSISYPPLGQGNDWESLREETAALLKKLNLDLPTYYDADNTTLSAVDRAVGFQGMPTTLLLDRRGIIRAVWVGYRPGVETEIELYIDKILGEEEK